MRILSAIGRFFIFLKQWLWDKPITPLPEEKKKFKAQELDLKNFYTVIEYKGQRINLNKHELTAFQNMNRSAKRQVLEHWKKLEKKGHVRFQEVNGQLVAIKNKDYESKADDRQ